MCYNRPGLVNFVNRYVIKCTTIKISIKINHIRLKYQWNTDSVIKSVNEWSERKSVFTVLCKSQSNKHFRDSEEGVGEMGGGGWRLSYQYARNLKFINFTNKITKWKGGR